MRGGQHTLTTMQRRAGLRLQPCTLPWVRSSACSTVLRVQRSRWATVGMHTCERTESEKTRKGRRHERGAAHTHHDAEARRAMATAVYRALGEVIGVQHSPARAEVALGDGPHAHA